VRCKSGVGAVGEATKESMPDVFTSYETNIRRINVLHRKLFDWSIEESKKVLGKHERARFWGSSSLADQRCFIPFFSSIYPHENKQKLSFLIQ